MARARWILAALVVVSLVGLVVFVGGKWSCATSSVPTHATSHAVPADEVAAAAPVVAPPTRVATDPERAVAPPWHLAGRAVSPRDRPIADVKVRVTVTAGGEAERHFDYATDADGRFGGEVACSATRARIAVATTGETGAFAPEQVKIVEPGETPEPLLLVCYAWHRRIQGWVVDETGRAIAGAALRCGLREVKSDADGNFAVTAFEYEGVASIWASATGFRGVHVAPAWSKGRDERGVEIVLQSVLGGSLRGTVRDALGGAVAGARVQLFAQRMHADAVTDRAGLYQIDGLERGADYGVNVRSPGFRLRAEQVKTGDEPQTRHDFTLDRGRRIAGRVVTRGGDVVAHADVWACEASQPPLREYADATTRSRGDGSFELTGIAPEPLLLFASDGTGQATAQADASTEIPGVTLVLDPWPMREGRVHDEAGAPIGGVFVRVDALGIETTSSADGRFRIPVPTGPTQSEVRFLRPGFVDKRVAGGACDDVALTQRGRLELRVVDAASGAPLDSFLVRLIAPTLQAGETAASGYGIEWHTPGVRCFDEGGRFDVDIDAPAGAVVGVAIEAKDHETLEVRDLKFQPIGAAPDSDPPLDLAVRPR